MSYFILAAMIEILNELVMIRCGRRELEMVDRLAQVVAAVVIVIGVFNGFRS